MCSFGAGPDARPCHLRGQLRLGVSTWAPEEPKRLAQTAAWAGGGGGGTVTFTCDWLRLTLPFCVHVQLP